MKHKQLATLLALMLLSFQLFAQGRVSGRVYDSKTGSPVEYATVALLSAQDSHLVTGTVTEGNGSFAVPVDFGRYLLRVSCMSYQTYFYPQTVVLTKNHA